MTAAADLEISEEDVTLREGIVMNGPGVPESRDGNVRFREGIVPIREEIAGSTSREASQVTSRGVSEAEIDKTPVASREARRLTPREAPCDPTWGHNQVGHYQEPPMADVVEETSAVPGPVRRDEDFDLPRQDRHTTAEQDEQDPGVNALGWAPDTAMRPGELVGYVGRRRDKQLSPADEERREKRRRRFETLRGDSTMNGQRAAGGSTR